MLEQKRVPVGCIRVEFMEERRGEIKHIAVSQKMRSRQIGRGMIATVQHKHKLLEIYAETDSDAF